MKIGFDFDGTYTADPVTMNRVIGALIDGGHQVVIVTNREGSPSDKLEVAELNAYQVPVVWCNGLPKREAAHRAGWDIDVWIDDNPILVDLGVEGLRRFPDRQGWHTKNADIVRRERERRENDWFAAFAEGRHCGVSAGGSEHPDESHPATLADWRISTTRRRLVNDELIDP